MDHTVELENQANAEVYQSFLGNRNANIDFGVRLLSPFRKAQPDWLRGGNDFQFDDDPIRRDVKKFTDQLRKSPPEWGGLLFLVQINL